MQCQKVKYSSEHYAQLDLKRISKKSTRVKVPHRVYLCECGSWHLTSRVSREEIEIEKLRKELTDTKAELNKNNIRLIELEKCRKSQQKLIIKLQKEIKESNAIS